MIMAAALGTLAIWGGSCCAPKEESRDGTVERCVKLSVLCPVAEGCLRKTEK